MAANAAGTHPEPCRTRQLSLLALMVLYGVHTGEQTVASINLREREVVSDDSFPLLLYMHSCYVCIAEILACCISGGLPIAADYSGLYLLRIMCMNVCITSVCCVSSAVYYAAIPD